MASYISLIQRFFLSLAVVCALAGCKETLYSRLSEQEANDMVLVLQMAGIAVSKDRLDEKNWEVRVGANDMAAALAALKEAGMPKASHTEIGDLFKKQGLVSSPFEQRVRYLHGVSQELSHTLSQIDGVVSARVHIVIPSPSGDAPADQKATASIFIKHRKEVNLESQAIAIKQLVANGVDGLDYENISLALFPTNVSTDGKIPQIEGWSLPIGIQSLTGLVLVVVGLLIAFLIGSGRGAGGAGSLFRSSRSRSGDSSKKPYGA
jgi:type III secretion protein J